MFFFGYVNMIDVLILRLKDCDRYRKPLTRGPAAESISYP